MSCFEQGRPLLEYLSARSYAVTLFRTWERGESAAAPAPPPTRLPDAPLLSAEERGTIRKRSNIEGHTNAFLRRVGHCWRRLGTSGHDRSSSNPHSFARCASSFCFQILRWSA